MRKFLLTWYGITDFRASLGFENTDGPIAAALATESYSDVVILCYTRADNDSTECIESQKSFATKLDSIRDAGQEKDWKTTGDFVSRFANTAVAHDHFMGWLKAKVQNANGSMNFCIKSEKLRELNDTEGIYACAMRALDWVAQESGEKHVTLYLSPGTPVMAFVWAFAALGHPALKKRLIASPVIGKPPETISLPADWLERHCATQKATRDATNGFDVTFHLFGEQRMPALLGIRQFESKHHIFVNSKEYPAKSMRAFIKGSGFDELPVDPWDAKAVREQIIRRAEKLPVNARIGVNLTGGTKLMFAGALAAARALGAAPFYFDSQNRRVTFVDTFRSASIKPIDSVKTFLLLHGDELKLSNNGVTAELSRDRRLLAETLWKHRSKIANCYPQLRGFNDTFRPFRVESKPYTFELDKNKVATVVGDGLDLRFVSWPGFAKYLYGGWFEEYAYLQFKPYVDAGVIKDLRINVELRLDRECRGKFPRWANTHNELDIAFTDGYSLYIVECKAGNVTQEQIMKLQNLVRFYGGVEGRGIVACCFPPNAESVQKKIKDAKLTLCCGQAFSEQVEAIMSGIIERTKSIGESI
jgi:Domain of unknown function (DUF1887)